MTIGPTIWDVSSQNTIDKKMPYEKLLQDKKVGFPIVLWVL